MDGRVNPGASLSLRAGAVRPLAAGSEPSGIRRSVPALLAELSRIREVDRPNPSREDGAEPELRTKLSPMSAERRWLYEVLRPKEYLS